MPTARIWRATPTIPPASNGTWRPATRPGRRRSPACPKMRSSISAWLYGRTRRSYIRIGYGFSRSRNGSPGVPVAAGTSEALAVGESGEVARYMPDVGWVPETLLGPGGRHEATRLRAVTWPTPSRAYAVGDSSTGSSGDSVPMWLWRSETGLWEPDPATPLNFRGNLLGIAFDPSNPALGFAVGTDGVLLRFGKTWAQEALPEAVRGASFTSIAFAGSEAIVAFHQNHETGPRTGGLLVDNGAGWHVDEAAAAAMGANVPVTVAALPDGGAAVATIGEGAQIFERNAQGSSWQATAVPLPPPAVAPGSLALFREGEALRVIAAGIAPIGTEVIPAPPPGFPPTLEEPAPVPSAAQERGVVRQTAGGWSDEEHELNLVKAPAAGLYKLYDRVYEPDPIGALLVAPSGAEGWAVGGFEEAGEQRAGHRRRRALRDQPVCTAGTARDQAAADPVAAEPDDVTLAVGGGAQCAAPCANRARAGIGPDVWLSSALARAHESDVVEGVSAFLYTGPRLSSGRDGRDRTAVPVLRRACTLCPDPGGQPATCLCGGVAYRPQRPPARW